MTCYTTTVDGVRGVLANRGKTGADLMVSKTWVNLTGESNPTSVTAQLFRSYDEEIPYKTWTLNADNNWSNIFTNLPAEDAEGNRSEERRVGEEETSQRTSVDKDKRLKPQ